MRWLERDSVSLFYKEAPGGAPPLVLVHGLACDHSFMAPQFDAFAGLHHVVAVDLRGHGQSDKPQQDYTIPAFADDLAWVLRELALERPVVIGHSMGGAIGLELAAEQPESLSGVVVLDTAVLPSPDVWAGVQPVIAALKAPGYEQAAQRFFAEAFFLRPTTPNVRRPSSLPCCRRLNTCWLRLSRTSLPGIPRQQRPGANCRRSTSRRPTRAATSSVSARRAGPWCTVRSWAPATSCSSRFPTR